MGHNGDAADLQRMIDWGNKDRPIDESDPRIVQALALRNRVAWRRRAVAGVTAGLVAAGIALGALLLREPFPKWRYVFVPQSETLPLGVTHAVTWLALVAVLIPLAVAITALTRRRWPGTIMVALPFLGLLWPDLGLNLLVLALAASATAWLCGTVVRQLALRVSRREQDALANDQVPIDIFAVQSLPGKRTRRLMAALLVLPIAACLLWYAALWRSASMRLLAELRRYKPVAERFRMTGIAVSANAVDITPDLLDAARATAILDAGLPPERSPRLEAYMRGGDVSVDWPPGVKRQAPQLATYYAQPIAAIRKAMARDDVSLGVPHSFSPSQPVLVRCAVDKLCLAARAASMEGCAREAFADIRGAMRLSTLPIPGPRPDWHTTERAIRECTYALPRVGPTDAEADTMDSLLSLLELKHAPLAASAPSAQGCLATARRLSRHWTDARRGLRGPSRLVYLPVVRVHMASVMRSWEQMTDILAAPGRAMLRKTDAVTSQAAKADIGLTEFALSKQPQTARVSSVLLNECLHAQMRIRATRIVIALRRYRDVKKEVAPSLEALCPKYLSSVPTDPMSGEPMLLHRHGDTALICCPAEDAIGANAGAPVPGIIAATAKGL